jgi:hypothetical protein
MINMHEWISTCTNLLLHHLQPKIWTKIRAHMHKHKQKEYRDWIYGQKLEEEIQYYLGSQTKLKEKQNIIRFSTKN